MPGSGAQLVNLRRWVRVPRQWGMGLLGSGLYQAMQTGTCFFALAVPRAEQRKRRAHRRKKKPGLPHRIAALHGGRAAREALAPLIKPFGQINFTITSRLMRFVIASQGYALSCTAPRGLTHGPTKKQTTTKQQTGPQHPRQTSAGEGSAPMPLLLQFCGSLTASKNHSRKITKKKDIYDHFLFK